jgi:diaminopimelate epimerase
VKFTKMHALGNDFIVVDARTQALPSPEEFARSWCHRRFGIGADQVLLLEDSAGADFAMKIYNADGSEVEMCGNGIRALARFIWDRELSGKDVLAIETPAGIIRPRRTRDLIRVDMGVPVFEARDIPVNLDGIVRDHPLQVDDRTFAITCVSMGNPHAVIFVDGVKDFPVDRYGPLIEGDPLFPNRINVEFIEVLDPKEIRMRVWERGTGETPACGTGASAAAVVSAFKGLTERAVTVHLTGGDLLIEWGDDDRVAMTGPATEVFEGELRT